MWHPVDHLERWHLITALKICLNSLKAIGNLKTLKHHTVLLLTCWILSYYKVYLLSFSSKGYLKHIGWNIFLIISSPIIFGTKKGHNTWKISIIRQEHIWWHTMGIMNDAYTWENNLKLSQGFYSVFTKQTDVLPRVFKSQFSRHLRSGVAKIQVKFQSDTIVI